MGCYHCIRLTTWQLTGPRHTIFITRCRAKVLSVFMLCPTNKQTNTHRNLFLCNDHRTVLPSDSD